jgi:hypothetical protein
MDTTKWDLTSRIYFGGFATRDAKLIEFDMKLLVIKSGEQPFTSGVDGHPDQIN